MKNKKLLLATVTFIALTITTIAQVPSYVPTSGLLGWWPFNGNANDLFGGNNNGVVTGASLTTDRFNTTNSAYQFNGTSNYILVNSIPTNNTQYSIAAWAKANAINQATDGIAVQTGIKNGTRYGSFGIRATDDGTRFIGVHRNSSEVLQAINNSQSQDLTWHHYVQTWNGNQVKLYVDGVLKTTVNISSTSTRNTQFTIGAMYGVSFANFFNGKIDDVGFWTIALTPCEVSNLYYSQIFAEPTITSSGSTTFCQGDSVVLTSSSAIGNTWSNGATTQSITVTTAGAYSVTASNGACSATSLPQYVTVHELPTLATTASSSFICNGNTSTLDVSGALTYTWQPGNLSGATITVSPTVNTTYTVTGQDANGCVDSSTNTIFVNALPISNINLTDNDTICDGSSTTLTATGGIVYAWSNGLNTASNSVNTTGIYTVVVTDLNGCVDTSQISITVASCFLIPNGFSPNGDGINDTWEIAGIGNYPNAQVTVLNRWGQEMLNTNNYSTPWDGSFKGGLLPISDYYYIINLNDGSNPLTGTLTIKR